MTPKFKELDIVCKPGNVYPIIILGEHTFPDGKLAYRCRHTRPLYDDLDGTEHWDKQDWYIHQSHVDEHYELIWRRP